MKEIKKYLLGEYYYDKTNIELAKIYGSLEYHPMQILPDKVKYEGTWA